MFLVGFFIIVLTLAAPFMLILGPIAVLWWLFTAPFKAASSASRATAQHQAEWRRLDDLGGAEPPPAPPGWYPDVYRPGQVRYWDGTEWVDAWQYQDR